MKEKIEKKTILTGKIVKDNDDRIENLINSLKKKETIKIPFLYEGKEIGFSILNFKNNSIESTIMDSKFIGEFNKLKGKYENISIGFKK